MQFVREFTVNAIEAIEARRAAGAENPGRDQVVWREFTELSEALPAPKLCCVDTGIGMTGEDLERYINALSSTSKRQALDGNYGMGAKIAGAEGNTAGMTYLSWMGSAEDGFTCTLARDPDAGWGLIEDPDTMEIITAAAPELCPREIREAGWRGTVVVFHGKSANDDTTAPPTQEAGVDWLERAVNVRFYELPADIEVRCQRAGGSALRQARGQRRLLDEHTVAQNTHRLTDATVHWRILDEHVERRRKQNGRWAASGHRAALHEGELYELRTAGGAGFRRLQEFGISFGYSRVVLYVEPDEVIPDTVRSKLVIEEGPEDKDLPWERWADEFVADMPAALRELVERSAGTQARRERRDVMHKMMEIARDIPLPSYRVSERGTEEGGPFTHGGSQGESEDPTPDPGPGPEPGPAPDETHGGKVVTLFTRRGGPKVKRNPEDLLPEIKPRWVKRADGSRVPPILDDRAAMFLPRQAEVHLTEDFRGYKALLKHFASKYGHLAGAGPAIEAEVQAACEDQVIEFIVGPLRLRSQPHWTALDVEHALDERSLTACLMQHAAIVAKVQKRLSQRFRAQKDERRAS